MNIRIQGIPTDEAARLRAGGPDANGQPPLRRRAEGGANPCRHCLGLIEDGDEKLVLSWRPFAEVQPYAEAGPVFLHARDCPRYDDRVFPAWFAFMQPAVVRGYDAADWIRYDTGDVVPGASLDEACRHILARAGVAYVHVRSKFGCFQCRVDQAEG